MSEDLKPCPNPWCPADSRRIIVWDLYSKRVLCTCGVKGPRSKTKVDTNAHSIPINNARQKQATAEAIAAWNHRTPDQSAQPDEAELVAIANKALDKQNWMPNSRLVSVIITALRPWLSYRKNVVEEPEA